MNTAVEATSAAARMLNLFTYSHLCADRAGILERLRVGVKGTEEV